MLYDANFRLNENEPELKVLDFGVVELIRRNERGELGGLLPNTRHKLVPIILRTVKEMDCGLGGTIMALPFGGDCFYCFTDPENPRYTPGGFLYEEEAMYYAKQLISLQHDRDGYRQQPTVMRGNYATDLSFKQVIESFHKEGVPLFRTVAEAGVYYDKKSWPNGQIPKVGKISYEEVFRELGL
jgi:hypothetical protein